MLPCRLQRLVLPLPLALVSAVLEPDLHLVGGEFEAGRQVLSLRGGQVSLQLEATLELEDLRLGEEHAGPPPVPLLLRRPITVSLPALRGLLPGHQTAALALMLLQLVGLQLGSLQAGVPVHVRGDAGVPAVLLSAHRQRAQVRQARMLI